MKSTIIQAIVMPLSFLVSLFLITKFLGPIPFSINQVTTTKQDTFDVTGEGKVSVKPDSAIIMGGVSENGQTAKKAQDKMNQKINQAIEAVKKLGIEQKDIKTENYSINPNYDYKSNIQTITNYTASTNITVSLKDISKVNQVIDTLTQNGINVVSGARFETKDKDKATKEARNLAIADAKRKAQEAASAAGFNLGRLVNYSEGTAPDIHPIPLKAESADLSSPDETNIEPGVNEIKITITLSYQID